MTNVFGKEKIFKKDPDTNLGPLVIMAFHYGILVHWSMNRDRIDGEAFVSTFKEIILDGLITKNAEENIIPRH